MKVLKYLYEGAETYSYENVSINLLFQKEVLIL